MNDIEQQINRFNILVREWHRKQEESDRAWERWLDANPFRLAEPTREKTKAFMHSSMMDREDRARLYHHEEYMGRHHYPEIEKARKAVDALIDCFESGPLSSLAVELRLAQLISEVDSERGSKFASRALKCQSQSADDALQLATFFAKNNRIEDAIQVIRQGLQEFNDNKLKKLLVKFLAKAGKTDELLNFVCETLNKHPDDVVLIEDAVEQLFENKKEDEAVEFLKRAVTVELLEKLFKEEHSVNLKLAVLRALVNIQGNEARSSVWEGLTLSGYLYSEKVRSYAAQALGDIGDSSLVQSLVQLLNEETDYSVRVAISNTLGKLDTEPRKWWEKLLGSRPWAK